MTPEKQQAFLDMKEEYIEVIYENNITSEVLNINSTIDTNDNISNFDISSQDYHEYLLSLTL